MLTYDDAKHEYRWNGAVVPHVTGVLAPLVDYSMVDADVMARAQELGTRTHRLVELECKQGLDINKLDPFWQPYLRAWRTFVTETGFKLAHSERRIYHRLYGFAGTLDLEGEIFGKPGIVDLKKSFAAGPATGLQIAAYLEARNDEKRRDKEAGKLKTRHALRLCPDEKQTYRLKPFEDDDEFGVFLGLLKTQRWKEKHHVQ